MQMASYYFVADDHQHNFYAVMRKSTGLVGTIFFFYLFRFQ